MRVCEGVVKIQASTQESEGYLRILNSLNIRRPIGPVSWEVPCGSAEHRKCPADWRLIVPACQCGTFSKEGGAL